MNNIEMLEDMSKSLEMISKDLIEIKGDLEKENADGCTGCAFITMEEWEMPCCKCKRNCKDYWRKADGKDA